MPRDAAPKGAPKAPKVPKGGQGSMPHDAAALPATEADTASHPVTSSVTTSAADGASKMVAKLSRGPTPPALFRGPTPTPPYLAAEPATSTALAAVGSAGVVASGDGSPLATQGGGISPAPPSGSPDGWLASDEAELLRCRSE